MRMESESGHVAFILSLNKEADLRSVPAVFPPTVNRFGFI